MWMPGPRCPTTPRHRSSSLQRGTGDSSSRSRRCSSCNGSRICVPMTPHWHTISSIPGSSSCQRSPGRRLGRHRRAFSLRRGRSGRWPSPILSLRSDCWMSSPWPSSRRTHRNPPTISWAIGASTVQRVPAASIASWPGSAKGPARTTGHWPSRCWRRACPQIASRTRWRCCWRRACPTRRCVGGGGTCCRTGPAQHACASRPSTFGRYSSGYAKRKSVGTGLSPAT